LWCVGSVELVLKEQWKAIGEIKLGIEDVAKFE
jgi:hypothetical protein